MEAIRGALDSLNLKSELTKTGYADELCKKHGVLKRKNVIGEVWCEQCEREEEEARDQKRQEEREAKEKAYRKAKAHGTLDLPKRLQRYSLDNFQANTAGKKKALAVCKDFLQHGKSSGGIVMIGGVGTGKTHLAVGICKELCDKGVSCKLLTVSQIIRRIKASWNKEVLGEWGAPMSEADVIEEFSSYGLLVIDEIGAQFGSDTERLMVTEIINNRYERELPTITIGNVSKSEMESFIGKRAVDRILHKGFLVVFDWNSYRTQV